MIYIWPVQDESHCGRSNIRVAQVGGGDNHRLYHLCDLVGAGIEHDCEVCGARMPGPTDPIREFMTSYLAQWTSSRGGKWRPWTANCVQEEALWNTSWAAAQKCSARAVTSLASQPGAEADCRSQSKRISSSGWVRNNTCAITFIKAGDQPNAGHK